MKERPILFSGAMVRAILEGRKTQTRRVVKPQPTITESRIAPGDHLWVRETWAYVGPGSGSDLPDCVEERKNPAHHTPRNCWYAANGERGIRWTPSIHMPRWASRITLEVTGVRVERVQDITVEDAEREGCDQPDWPRYYKGIVVFDAREAFAYLWDDINGPRGHGWERNPWVWVVEFRRLMEAQP